MVVACIRPLYHEETRTNSGIYLSTGTHLRHHEARQQQVVVISSSMLCGYARIDGLLRDSV